MRRAGCLAHDRVARCEVLHDRAENGRLENLPVHIGNLCDGHEITTQKNSGNFGHGEQALGKG